MATKYIVNNVSGQTINGELLQPYKVYTALLTQTGGDDPQTISAGALVVGVTYEITNYQSGDDFTNIGAPLNETGIKFVATGTSPNVWTNNSELSYNNGAPVVTVLENTIGNINFQYSYIGNYTVNCEPNNFFLVGKTIGFIGSVGDDPSAPSYGYLRANGPDRFIILTQDSTLVDADAMLLNTPIEIRVYN